MQNTSIPHDVIQKLFDDFEAGILIAHRLSDGALIEDLGDFVRAILADDCVVGSRAKFEAIRAEWLAAQAEAARPFSRILIPSAGAQ